MTDRTWFYQSEGKHLGPLRASELFELYHAGQIKDETYLWRMGQDDWMPLRSVPDIFLALYPDSKTKISLTDEAAINHPQDFVRHAREEIDREIPGPSLNKISMLRNISRPTQLRQEDLPPSLPAEQFDVQEMSCDEIPAPPSLLKTERVVTSLPRDFGNIIIFILATAFLTSIISVFSWRYLTLTKMNQEMKDILLKQAPLYDQSKMDYSILKDDNKLLLASNFLGPLQGRVRLISKPWNNTAQSVLDFEFDLQFEGGMAWLKRPSEEVIPNGYYLIELEVWSDDYVTKLLATISRLLGHPKIFRVTDFQQISFEKMIGESKDLSSTENQKEYLLAMQKDYETNNLLPYREALLRINTLLRLWQQVGELYQNELDAKKFVATYAEKIAPVFQGLSTEIGESPQNTFARNQLFQICLEFGENVSKMATYLLQKQTPIQKKTNKKDKPVSVVPLISQDELQILSDKLISDMQILARSWEEQLTKGEIKE